MSQLSMWINGFIAVVTVLAWGQLVLEAKETDRLAARGRESLKYFTVLSNFFSGLASAICLLLVAGGAQALPLWAVTLKLVATVAVMITFLTVMLLLGPSYGWKPMFRSGNLWLHLVLPLLAAVDCCLFVPVWMTPLWATLFSILPVALYGAWYLRMVLVHGAEENGKVYDFYGFLRWGMDKIWMVIAGMFLTSWVVCMVLRLLSGMLCVA